MPKWVWGVVGLVLLLCIGGSIAAFSAFSDGGFAFGDDPTEVAEPDDEDDEESVDEDATAEAIAARETEAAVPTATELPTESPTETAMPPTATATVEAGQPTPDALATRQSAEATRAASAPPTAPPPPGPRSGLAAIYGPIDGTLPHDNDDFIETLYADASPADFIMRVDVVNPYGPGTGGWDFGLIFRQSDVDDEMRLVIRSDGEWTLNDRTPGTDTFLQDGDVSRFLNLDSGGSNQLDLIAVSDLGFFFLNGEFIAQLDLSSRTTAGDVALGTGFYGDNEINGEATPYRGFGLWPISAVFGPSDGQLDHALDDLIKLEAANVDQVNFIAEATFTNPFAASVNDWDYGFSLRSNGSFKYWLVVASEGDWQLADRQGSADDEETVAEGTLTNLNLGENEQNRLLVFAWGNVGYFFVNDVFIAKLDLSSNVDSGDVEVITAYYFDHEIEGEAPGFENFVVIPLP